ncbi:protein FAM200A-like [Lycorma delicatula]|uniref:protein FAM200A-like n=1 Tax=Lycorma delicatula TaxID=130591 RepID=UPI003F519013
MVWSPRSPDLSPPDFYLWGFLKDNVYSNNPHILDELIRNIEDCISNITAAILKKVAYNTLLKMDKWIKRKKCNDENRDNDDVHDQVNEPTPETKEIKVSWKTCIGISIDGAPAMTGHIKGFVAHVKELNENILVTHCFLHREALVTKFLPSDLKIVLEQCVKMVNYIKSRPLKSRLFKELCQAMEANMQGPNENILNSTDKLVGLKKQITLWKNKAQEGNLEKFESVPKDSYKTIKVIVLDHLTALEERIVHYFPKLDIKKFDWVRNPFLITDTSVFDLTLNEEEELILLSSNRDLILKHSEESINSFWINIRCEYPIIAKKALYILLQFSTSYLCEFGFSALANIKTKKRSRLLNVEDDMRVALSFLRPNINEIIKKHQAQISH